MSYMRTYCEKILNKINGELMTHNGQQQQKLFCLCTRKGSVHPRMKMCPLSTHRSCRSFFIHENILELQCCRFSETIEENVCTSLKCKTWNGLNSCVGLFWGFYWVMLFCWEALEIGMEEIQVTFHWLVEVFRTPCGPKCKRCWKSYNLWN